MPHGMISLCLLVVSSWIGGVCLEVLYTQQRSEA